MIYIKTDIIGVDISTSSVKIAEIRKGRKNFVLKSFAEEKIPVSALVAGVIRQPETVKDALEKCLTEINANTRKKRYVVCTIPDDKVFIQQAVFPKLDHDKLKEAIQFKIQSFIPLPLTDVYWDFQVLSENKDQTVNVIISAAGRETIDSYYNVIRSVGLIPISFESSTSAALRILLPDDENAVILLDIGRTQTVISLAHEGVIIFSTTAHIGLNQIIKAYDDVFQVDDDKSLQLIKESGIDIQNDAFKEQITNIFAPLRQEIEKTINFQNSLSIKSLFIYGEGALIKGVKDLIIQNTGLTSSPIDIPIEIEHNSNAIRVIPVLGTAYKMLDKSKRKSIDFLPPDAAKQINGNIIKDKIFFMLRILALNMLAYTVIFIFFSVFLLTLEQYDQVKLTSVSQNVKQKEYDTVTAAINNDNLNLLKINKAELGFTNWMNLLNEIPSLVSPGISLTAYNINQSNKGWIVTISGVAGNRDELLAYLKNMQVNSKYLQGVTLPIQYIQDDGSVTFSITATIAKLS